MAEPVLVAEGVSRAYGALRATDGVSLDLRPLAPFEILSARELNYALSLPSLLRRLLSTDRAASFGKLRRH